VAASRLKPPVKSKRPQHLIKRQYVALTRTLEEALFRHADVMSEGSTRATPDARTTYFGSTMIAIAFDRLPSEANSVPRAELVSVIEGSVRVRLRAMRLARAEAVRRLNDSTLGTVLCDLRVHDAGEQLRIDVDLEVELRVSSRSKRS
jgi:hypothetical protein